MGDYSEYQQREKGERGPDGIANQITSKRNYPGYESYSFLLVEGKDDHKLYTKFIDEKQCQIIEPARKTLPLQG